MNTKRIGYWALAALAAAVLLWVVGGLIAGGTSGPPVPGIMPWGGGRFIGWPGMVVMMLGMVFFWLAVILGIALLVGWVIQASRGPSVGGEDPLEIARRRYARGEISRDEYERLRDDLGRTG